VATHTHGIHTHIDSTSILQISRIASPSLYEVALSFLSHQLNLFSIFSADTFLHGYGGMIINSKVNN